jgi:hypothetical protein
VSVYTASQLGCPLRPIGESMVRSPLVLLCNLGLLIGLILTPAGVNAAQPGCQLVLGFKTLHDLIPNVVGPCLENEHHNPENGDGLQRTTGGLLVWRKADNWTAFTDGSTTWINGPLGLQSRPNDQRFAWEPPLPRVAIEVFFSRHPASDDDFAAVFPVSRTAPDQGVATAAVEFLIAGPTPSEQAAGYFSELGQMLQGPSTCGGPDFRVTVESGTATVQFCRLVTSAGIGQDARTQSQLQTTLQQFPTVQRVRLLDQQSRCLFDQSGLNRC